MMIVAKLSAVPTFFKSINDQLYLQPNTGYDGNAGIQAVFLGQLNEISDWTKEGPNNKIINKAIAQFFLQRSIKMAEWYLSEP